MRTPDQKLECIKKVILNAQEHVRANDPTRVYSQYIRYALHDFSRVNFYVSEKAKGLKRKDVIYEHVVPHKIMMNKLLTLKQVTPDNIMSVIQKYYIICVITRDEDKLLSKAGLRSKMPDGWDGETDSVFARYEAIGIVPHKDQ